MSKAFRTLALLGKANSDDVNQTISALYDFLTAQHYKVLVESPTFATAFMPQKPLYGCR